MNERHTKFPVAVHLFLLRSSEVLLTRRHNTGYGDGLYSVVAGHLEGGESLIQATAREAAEEIGVRLSLSDIKLVGVMHRLSDEERVEFFLTSRSWHGQIFNHEPDKCDDVRWFRLDSLPGNIIPYVKSAIELIATGSPNLWFDEPDFQEMRLCKLT